MDRLLRAEVTFGNVRAVTASGSITITENGTVNVAQYAEAVVNVTVHPTGTITITENGDYDVSQYADAHVEVPGIVPTGTLFIEANDTYDVTDYALANVQVPEPSGTLDIDNNGTYDVTAYASAVVDVPEPDPFEGSYSVTPSASAQTLLTDGYVMTDDVTIDAIPYSEEDNAAGGVTVTIG